MPRSSMRLSFPKIATAGSALLIVVVAAACGGSTSSASPRPLDGSGTRSGNMVSAVVLMNGCSHLGKANAKLAETTIYGLIEACKAVPGGHTRLVATLRPGGQIDLATPAGETDTVPVCMLHRPLVHKLTLQKPCAIDVRLEESAVRVGTGLTTGDAGVDP